MSKIIFNDKKEFYLFLGILIISFLTNAIINMRGILTNTLFYTGFDIFPHTYYINDILNTGRIIDVLGYPRGLHLIIVSLSYTTGLPAITLFNIIGLFFSVLFISTIYLFIKKTTNNSYFAAIVAFIMSMLKSNGSALGFIWPFPSSLALFIIILALQIFYPSSSIRKGKNQFLFLLCTIGIFLIHKYSIIFLIIGYSVIASLQIIHARKNDWIQVMKSHLILLIYVVIVFGIPVGYYFISQSVITGQSPILELVTFLQNVLLLSNSIPLAELVYILQDVINPLNIGLVFFGFLLVREKKKSLPYLIPIFSFLLIISNPLFYGIIHRMAFPLAIALVVPIGFYTYEILENRCVPLGKNSKRVKSLFLIGVFLITPLSILRYPFSGVFVNRMSSSELLSYSWMNDNLPSSQVLSDPTSSWIFDLITDVSGYPGFDPNGTNTEKIHGLFQNNINDLIEYCNARGYDALYVSPRTSLWLKNSYHYVSYSIDLSIYIEPPVFHSSELMLIYSSNDIFLYRIINH